MASDGQGSIYISYEDFNRFVLNHSAIPPASTFVIGKPKLRYDYVEIAYAFSTDGNPSSWADKPLAVREIEELERKDIEKLQNT